MNEDQHADFSTSWQQTIWQINDQLQQFTSTMQTQIQTITAIVPDYSKYLQNTVLPQLNTLSIQLSPVLQNLLRHISQIDFAGLSEAFRNRLKEWDIWMKEFDTNLWTVDDDLFNYIFDQEFIIPAEDATVSKYVESRLDEYLQLFGSESVYENHRGIIHDAYEAFQKGKFTLAMFPLMATADFIIDSTFKDYTMPPLPKEAKWKRNKTYYKVLNYVETKEDELAMSLLLYRRVINVYAIIFHTYKENSPLNRHGIMHGLYNYATITKFDVLKMFQFLKATIILKEITFE